MYRIYIMCAHSKNMILLYTACERHVLLMYSWSNWQGLIHLFSKRLKLWCLSVNNDDKPMEGNTAKGHSNNQLLLYNEKYVSNNHVCLINVAIETNTSSCVYNCRPYLALKCAESLPCLHSNGNLFRK